MYPSTDDYQKKSTPPSAPYGETAATGIPVNAGNYYSQRPPTSQPTASSGPSQWSSGLCGCGSDVCNCCITCWCPCITFGQIAEIVDQGATSCGVSGALYFLIAFFTGCPCIYSCFYRSRIRQHFRLPESPCNDCLLHCCCETCALCQEYRELKHRGFDMAIGWQGNMEKHGHGVAMAPSVESGMSR